MCCLKLNVAVDTVMKNWEVSEQNLSPELNFWEIMKNIFSIWHSENFLAFLFISINLHALQLRNIVTVMYVVYFHKNKTKNGHVFIWKTQHYKQKNTISPLIFF
jgi:hypothetical protein